MKEKCFYLDAATGLIRKEGETQEKALTISKFKKLLADESPVLMTLELERLVQFDFDLAKLDEYYESI